MLCKISDVDGIVLAVHADEPVASGLPQAEFVDILLRWLRQAGFRVHDALCRASNGLGSYLDPDLPADGYPLSDLVESASRLPPSVQVEASGVEIPSAKRVEKERMRREFAHYRALIDALDESDENPPELEPFCDLPMFVEEALRWDADERNATGALLMVALQGPPVRDATMLQWAFGFQLGDVLYDQAERFARDGLDLEGERSNALGNLMLGIGPRPDHTRIERGINLLLDLVSRAAPRERLAPLCMLAWLSWALGSGTQAGRFVDEARSIDAEYGMAELLDTMLSNGFLPEWVFIAPDDEGDAL